VDHVWAGWRFTGGAGNAADGRPNVQVDPDDGRTLFEALEQSDRGDEETYIVWRGDRCFAILNVFPYNPGHVMVLPKRAARSMEDLDAATFDELWRSVRSATIAVKRALSPHGVNVGINDGEAGGGSVPDHLHVHVVPRWRSDTNFVTTTANTRVLPVALADTWKMVTDAWPSSPPGTPAFGG